MWVRAATAAEHYGCVEVAIWGSFRDYTRPRFIRQNAFASSAAYLSGTQQRRAVQRQAEQSAGVNPVGNAGTVHVVRAIIECAGLSSGSSAGTFGAWFRQQLDPLRNHAGHFPFVARVRMVSSVNHA